MNLHLCFTSNNLSSRGISLLETLVSLLITGIIGLGIVYSYRDITALSLTSSQIYRDVKSYALISALMHTTAADVDRHRLILLPRITTRSLKYLNGDSISTNTIPDDDSSILFYLKLNPLAPITLKEKNREGPFITAHVCAPHAALINEEMTYIALAPTGIFEVIVTPGFSSNDCRSVTIRAGKGIVAPPPSSAEFLTIQKVILAEEVYAYLRDERKQLRRLSFKADIVIENQPIASHASPFILTQMTSTDKIWQLSINVLERVRIQRSIPVFARLSREHHATILYNGL